MRLCAHDEYSVVARNFVHHHYNNAIVLRISEKKKPPEKYEYFNSDEILGLQSYSTVDCVCSCKYTEFEYYNADKFNVEKKKNLVISIHNINALFTYNIM